MAAAGVPAGQSEEADDVVVVDDGVVVVEDEGALLLLVVVDEAADEPPLHPASRAHTTPAAPTKDTNLRLMDPSCPAATLRLPSSATSWRLSADLTRPRRSARSVIHRLPSGDWLRPACSRDLASDAVPAARPDAGRGPEG